MHVGLVFGALNLRVVQPNYIINISFLDLILLFPGFLSPPYGSPANDSASLDWVLSFSFQLQFFAF
jgi:hypothetical protein